MEICQRDTLQNEFKKLLYFSKLNNFIQLLYRWKWDNYKIERNRPNVIKWHKSLDDYL